MKNNYKRYLSDKLFRDTVNSLTDIYTDLILADKKDEYGHEDWLAAAEEAARFVGEGRALMDDEEAAEYLPKYEEWLRQHPFGIDLTEESKTVQ